MESTNDADLFSDNEFDSTDKYSSASDKSFEIPYFLRTPTVKKNKCILNQPNVLSAQVANEEIINYLSLDTNRMDNLNSFMNDDFNFPKSSHTSFNECDEKENSLPKSNAKVEDIFSSDDESDDNLDHIFAPPTEESYEKIVNSLKAISPDERIRFNFIHSLMDQVDNQYRDPEAHRFRINYKYHKTQLARKIFNVFNKDVFSSKLPQDTQINFNPHMLKTGGVCICKGKTHEAPRHIVIEISTKICSDAERLLTVMIHEMCHGAVWMINHNNGGHGPLWRAWCLLAKNTYPLVPLSTQCHTYVARFKHQYRCDSCQKVYPKHSKSMKNKACVCKGTLVLFTDGGYGVHLLADVEKPLNGFAAYVKENYKTYRCLAKTHKDAMKILSDNFNIEKNKTEDELRTKLKRELMRNSTS